MVVETKVPVGRQAYRKRIEATLVPLWHRKAAIEKTLNALERRPPIGSPRVDLAVTARQRAREVAAQIDDQLALLRTIEDASTSPEAETPASVEPERDAAALEAASDELSARIAETRREIAETLRALAEPLRRYERLVAEKTEVTRKLADTVGRNLAYSNYIECALLRQSEFEGDLRYVVELIKRQHVAS